MRWSFRKVEAKDSDIIFNWRNNPEVYRYLFHAGPIDIESHEQWLKRITNDNSILFLMASFEGRDVGTIRFNFNSEFTEAEVGIYLSPDLHGKGLSSVMLSEAENEAKRRVGSLRKIIARVIPENVASEKMFGKTGYQRKFIQFEKMLEK